MLNPFRVLDPTTVAQAARELERLGEQAKVYAGGAELLLLLRHRLIQADYLLNIKRIPGLNQILWDGSVLRIGTTVTHRRLETDPLVRRHLPMLAYAESKVANVRVRIQGTLGGNLCFNDPHSDPATALLVYDATLTVAGARGDRLLPLRDFLMGLYATALGPDELLVEVQVPPLPPGYGSAYLRVHRFQRPTLGVAAAARFQDGRIDSVRLAVGCVGPRAERLTDLESRLQGSSLPEAEKIIGGARPYLKELLRPVSDLLGCADYKLYMTGVLLGKALAQAAGPHPRGSAELAEVPLPEGGREG